MEPAKDGLPRLAGASLSAMSLGETGTAYGTGKPGILLGAFSLLPQLLCTSLLGFKTCYQFRPAKTLRQGLVSACDQKWDRHSATNPQMKELHPDVWNLSMTWFNPCPLLGLSRKTSRWTHLLTETHQEPQPSSRSFLPV